MIIEAILAPIFNLCKLDIFPRGGFWWIFSMLFQGPPRDVLWRKTLCCNLWWVGLKIRRLLDYIYVRGWGWVIQEDKTYTQAAKAYQISRMLFHDSVHSFTLTHHHKRIKLCQDCIYQCAYIKVDTRLTRPSRLGFSWIGSNKPG